MQNHPEPLPTIGRKTKVELVDLGVKNVAAKVDTGAYHNAIHCSDVVLHKEEGKRFLTFKVLDNDHPSFKKRTITAHRFGKKRVKNSFGVYQTRYLVRLSIRIEGEKKLYKVHFTLADRSRMRTPVLLGRKFLKHRFLVDVRHSRPIQ